jgi:hypothetical protein
MDYKDFIYMYVCIRIYHRVKGAAGRELCASKDETERQRDRETERQRDRVTEKRIGDPIYRPGTGTVCVSVCLCVCV